MVSTYYHEGVVKYSQKLFRWVNQSNRCGNTLHFIIQ